MLLDYFTEANIVNIVARWRAQQAKKRHDSHFLHRIATIAGKYNTTNSLSAIDEYCPPRNHWVRPSFAKRKSAKDGDTNLLAIKLTIGRALGDSTQQNVPYVINLRRLIANVRWRVAHFNHLAISEPHIVPLTKGTFSKTGAEQFRPLSLFETEDRIILNLTAKYISEKFDPLFYPNSYAFRRHCREGKIPNHHDAVIDLLEYRKKNIGKTLYAAEMDIQSFFDCVHHDVANEKFDALRLDVTARGESFDPAASAIFRAYLRCYNFQYAMTEANNYFSRHGIKGELKWPRPELVKWFYKKEMPVVKVGIPQGGAISPLIANMILHECDKVVLKARKGQGTFFYARYCDDMIAISPNKKRTGRILQAYKNALFEQKLLYHKPKQLRRYSGKYKKEFWECKSKLTFPWGKRSYPWIAFVGYQIRYDSLIRVRKASLTKEVKKQKVQKAELLDFIRYKKITKSRNAILHRIRTRLVAMSVGKISVTSGKWERSSYSWINGFKILGKDRNILLTQLRDLDRFRNRRLREIKKILRTFRTPRGKQMIKPAEKSVNEAQYPKSYFAQIKEFVGYNG